MLTRDTILVLDFGSPYTKLIAKKIRQNRVYSKILSFDVGSPKEILKIESLKGIILSEGPISIDEKKPLIPKKRILKLGIPVLGLNYGALIIAYLLKGKVKFAKKREFLKTEVFIDDFSDIFYKFPANFTSDLCAQEGILKIPRPFKSIAHTLTHNFIAMSGQKRKIYGIRLHPEIFNTPKGDQILSNFLFRICDCKRLWSIESFIKDKVGDIKKNVGKKRVIIELDGSLNSVVCATLIRKAVGRNLRCVFIDNGFFYDYRETKTEMKKVSKDLHLNLAYLNKGNYFLNRLKGVIYPEKKRDILRKESSNIFENESKKIKNLEFLALPTLYSDLIEKRKLKSPLKKLKIMEPLKDLFEDEVKGIAERFGLPLSFINRRIQLACEIPLRIKGEVTEDRLRILREAEIILNEEIERINLANIQKIFATLIPLSYENTLILNCLSKTTKFDLEWSRLPYEFLERISKKLISEVKGIDRVAYDITS